jgi:uncharacterized protein (DUF736 family)
MNNLVNYIKIDGDKVAGNIATITFDIDVTGEAVQSENPKAPVFRLYAKSPRNRQIEIGGIWKKKNRQDADYFTLSVNTGFAKLNANLGRFPGQDDESLMASIPWD